MAGNDLSEEGKIISAAGPSITAGISELNFEDAGDEENLSIGSATCPSMRASTAGFIIPLVLCAVTCRRAGNGSVIPAGIRPGRISSIIW